jgi:hypothetical protein
LWGAFDVTADSLISTVPADSVSPIDAFEYISRLCALSNEGHFSTSHWQDDVHAGFLANEYLYLPVSVKVLQKKLMVWSDVSGKQKLKRGDEILLVNHLPAKTIRKNFTQRCRQTAI